MIWIVDDDSTIRDIEVYTLNSTGFEAKSFASGAPMFEALKTERPDLIVLDIMMPGDDGITILKKLRGNPTTKDIPIIMATAKGTEMDMITGLDTGADDYLVKPFGIMTLVSRIKAVLRRCGKQDDGNLLSAHGITKLLAQGHNVHNHGTAFTDEFLAPDFMHQGFPIKNLSWVLQEEPQDGKFLFRQFQILAEYTDFVVFYIHGNTVSGKLIPLFLFAASA